MDLSRFISEVQRILEAPYSQYVGAMGRPDADYVGQAYKRHDIPLGGKKFPYDRDRDDDPWQLGRGRGNADHQPLRRPFTAKSKGVTRKSGFEEAAGTPVNQSMGSRGGQQTGNPAGGMGGSWANRPVKPWDDEDDDDFMDTVARYGESIDLSGKRYAAMMRHVGEQLSDQTGEENSDPMTDEDRNVLGLPIAVERPAVVGSHEEDQDDQNLDTLISQNTPGKEDNDFVSFPSVLMQVMGSDFGTGLGKTNPSGRGFMTGWTEQHDLLAAEGAWAALAKLMGL